MHHAHRIRAERRHAARLLLGVLAAVFLVAARPTPAVQPLPAPQLQALVDGLVRDDSTVRNCVLAVMRGDGASASVHAAGIARQATGRPMTPTTPIYISSVTKLYTATVVMMLAERGRLALSAPMARYLPAATTAGLNTFDGRDRSGEITVAHLLAHRSGIPDYYTERGADGQSVEQLVQQDPLRAWSVDAAIARVRNELRAQSAPGTRTTYSDTNYLLLGRIVEAVTHEPLARVYDELLFRPLGLDHTFLVVRGGASHEAVDVADVFHGTMNVTRSRANPVYWADGAIVSTAEDMVRFLAALRSGRLVSPASLASMHAWNDWRFPIRYGLGTMEFRLPEPVAHWSGVPPLWGHSGSTGAFLYYSEDMDLYVGGTIDQTQPQWKPFVLIGRALRLAQARPGAPR